MKNPKDIYMIKTLLIEFVLIIGLAWGQTLDFKNNNNKTTKMGIVDMKMVDTKVVYSS